MELGLATEVPTLTVSGTTEPGATLVVNGVVVEVTSTGAFAFELGPPEGRNTVTATATDPAGNAAMASVTVTYANPVPGLEQQLGQTQNDLDATKNDLATTQTDLTTTKQELEDTRTALGAANADLAAIGGQVLTLLALVLMLLALLIVQFAVYVRLRGRLAAMRKGPSENGGGEDEG